MKDFDEFLKKLLDNPSRETTLSIKGQPKNIKAFVRLTSINYNGAEYYKILFDDKSYLLIVPADKELYYADALVDHIPGISDEMIGKQEVIEYNGKKYKLENKDDYQFVLQLYVGKPTEIDSECRFSDYTPVEGPKEFLSLGWLTYNNKRADIHCTIIDHSQVDFIS